MLDDVTRRTIAPTLDRIAVRLVARRITTASLTMTGLVIGLASAVAAALALWPVALVLWPLSRVFDLLDGAVARAADDVNERDGWLDLVADFTVYGAFVVGCGIGQPDARLACLVLLGTYYLNGSTFLAFSSASERLRRDRPATSTFHFQRGLAEGTETVIAHTLMVAVPSAMPTIAWAFAAVVAVTVLQRVAEAWRALG